MPCPCGSAECDCQEDCVCYHTICQCSKCESLQKTCRQCGLPFYVIILKEGETKEESCSCNTQELPFHPETHYNLSSPDLPRRKQSAAVTVVKNQCPRCSLPIVIVTKIQERYRVLCCCSHRTPATSTSEKPTEHESSSDRREVSADRQVRKTQSRKTRTEKSKWQAKKAKGKKQSPNSDAEFADIEKSEEALPSETSTSSSAEQGFEQDVTCFGSSEDMNDSIIQDLNQYLSMQSPSGSFSRTDDTSTGDVSTSVNTSGIYNPFTTAYFSKTASLGFLQLLSQNIRPKLPPPFPRLPTPVPGPPAFGANIRQYGGCQPKRTPHENHPFRCYLPTIPREEKMEKWFHTLENVISTSGELPDAETAAAFNEEDKERLEQQPKGKQAEQPGEKLVEQSKCLSYAEKSACSKSQAGVRKTGEKQGVVDPAAETDESSTLTTTSSKESKSD